MKFKQIVFCAVAAGMVAAPVYAQNSFAAEYDSARPVKMTGAVTKVDWANPHVYFFIDVKDPARARSRTGL
jgi:hypothetical protein